MIEEGARVQVSRSIPAGGHWLPPRAGTFTVDEVVRIADIPDYDPEEHYPVDYIEGTEDGGSTVIVPLDAVEVVMSASAMRKRKLPTPAEIVSEIAGEVMSSYDTFEVDEVDYGSKDGTFEAYGRTHDGLGLAFQVRVVAVWETDL